MKFLIDEQLPQLLADWLRLKGYDAIHVSALSSDASIPDNYICERSMDEDLFRVSLSQLITALEKNQVIELNQQLIKIRF